MHPNRKILRPHQSLNTSFNNKMDMTLNSEWGGSEQGYVNNFRSYLEQKSDEINQLVSLSNQRYFSYNQPINICHHSYKFNVNTSAHISMNNQQFNKPGMAMRNLQQGQLGDRVLMFQSNRNTNRLRNKHRRFTTQTQPHNLGDESKIKRSKNMSKINGKDNKQTDCFMVKAGQNQTDSNNGVKKEAVINNLKNRNQILSNITNVELKNNLKLLKTKQNKNNTIAHTKPNYHEITLAKTKNKFIDMDQLQQRFHELQSKPSYPQPNAESIQQQQKQNQLQQRVGFHAHTNPHQTPLLSRGHSKTSSLAITNLENINNQLNLGLKMIDDSFQIQTFEKQNELAHLTSNKRDKNKDEYTIHMNPHQIEGIILDQSQITPTCHMLTDVLNQILQTHPNGQGKNWLKPSSYTYPHTRTNTNTNTIVPTLVFGVSSCHSNYQCFVEQVQCQFIEDNDNAVQIQLCGDEIMVVENIGLAIHRFQYNIYAKTIISTNHSNSRYISRIQYLQLCLQTLINKISHPNIISIYKHHHNLTPRVSTESQNQAQSFIEKLNDKEELYIISEEKLWSSSMSIIDTDYQKVGKYIVYKQPVLISGIYSNINNLEDLVSTNLQKNHKYPTCETDRTHKKTKVNSGTQIKISWEAMQKLTNYINCVYLSIAGEQEDWCFYASKMLSLNMDKVYLCKLDYQQNRCEEFTFKIDLCDLNNMISMGKEDQTHQYHKQYQSHLTQRKYKKRKERINQSNMRYQKHKYSKILFMHNIETVHNIMMFLWEQAEHSIGQQNNKTLCHHFIQLVHQIRENISHMQQTTTIVQNLLTHPYITNNISPPFSQQFYHLLY